MFKSFKKSSDDHHLSASERMLQEWLHDKRSKRRWLMLFRALIVLWLFLTLMSQWSSNEWRQWQTTEKHLALVDIVGAISEDSDNNCSDIIRSLNRAFKSESKVGIVLRINSPGGAPVTADVIYHEIKSLKERYPDTKLTAVCGDMCASAAYYIASAADEIHANPASFVGSISVLYNGFGYVDTLKKLGVERRIFTSGKHKGFLDPFSPVKEEEVGILKEMLQELHQQFVKDVKAGRGSRLKENALTFSGLYWTGIRAKEMGLIDGFENEYTIARKHDITKLINYTSHKTYLERLMKQLETSVETIKPWLTFAHR